MENYNQSYEQNQPFGKSILSGLEVDQNVKISLAEAAKWAKFMGIIGMVMIALMVFGGIAMMAMGSLFLNQMPETQNMPFSPGLFGIIYIVAALLYIYPTWTLLKFGSQTRTGIKYENQIQFNQGLKNLMHCFKFVGILTIIMIAIYVIAIIAIAVGAGIGAMN